MPVCANLSKHPLAEAHGHLQDSEEVRLLPLNPGLTVPTANSKVRELLGLVRTILESEGSDGTHCLGTLLPSTTCAKGQSRMRVLPAPAGVFR